jgi:hypothetical protein
MEVSGELKESGSVGTGKIDGQINNTHKISVLKPLEEDALREI